MAMTNNLGEEKALKTIKFSEAEPIRIALEKELNEVIQRYQEQTGFSLFDFWFRAETLETRKTKVDIIRNGNTTQWEGLPQWSKLE